MQFFLKFFAVVLCQVYQPSQSFFMDGQNYSLAPFEDMCSRQKSFVLDAWKVQDAWINPSMTLSLSDPTKVLKR